jgi:transcription elongation factor SPT5
LSTMNPALKRSPSGAPGGMQPPKTFGRDRAMGQTVSIRRGGYKALMGIVKDTTDTHARVELHGKNKIVTVPKADLIYKDKVTGKTIDIYSRSGRGGFGGGPGRGGFGGMGDRPGGSRTPMGTGGGERTPAWGASKCMFASSICFNVPVLTVTQPLPAHLPGAAARPLAHAPPPGATAPAPSILTMATGQPTEMATAPHMEEPQRTAAAPAPRPGPRAPRPPLTTASATAPRRLRTAPAAATPGAPRPPPTASQRLPPVPAAPTAGATHPARAAALTHTMRLLLVLG